ncbi:MAG: AarF/ABC1/UbiB kinase family protein [Acidobacteria bacterium]|nr:AarF/ABC1/UbiB kinase family protein [Acidobacteriota bacterium]
MSATKRPSGSARPLASAAAGLTGNVVGDMLQRLFHSTSATGRALRLAGLTAGVTGSYVGYMAQRMFLGVEGRDTKRRATHAKTGHRIRDELQLLRGPVMKVGQALSLHTDLVPEEMLAELTKLQMEAPGMHPSLALAQFRASVGRSPEQVFKRFDAEPFAAASLGQVHRAVMRDGTCAAVKIQYPGIRAAIESDFRWIRNVTLPAQASGHLPKAALDEMESQIVAETDYVREADHIEFFRTSLKPLDFVVVPDVYRDCSTDRVLTMSVVAGQHLDAFLAKHPSQRLRDIVGSRLLELFYFQVLILKVLHADPHWGNYLFNDDGTIGLVDFGCVKQLGSEFIGRLRKSFLYPGRTDSPDFRRIVQEQFGSPGKKLSSVSQRAVADFAERFYRKVYPPDLKDADRAFDFSDPGFLRDFLRAAGKLARAKGSTTEYIFLVRAEIGLYTTLHRLKARVHTSAIVRRLLAESRKEDGSS